MGDKSISINGLNINYKIIDGSDPFFDFAGIEVFPDKTKIRGAVLILHGWGGSSDSWVQVQKILAKNGYRTIAPDFPGFGKSVTPPQAWGIKDYTKLVLNFVEEIELDNFFLLGHSFGGRISIRFAKKYPGKIKGLILCDAAGVKPKTNPKTMLIFYLAKIGNALFSPKPLKRFKDGFRNHFYHLARVKDYARAKGVMKETIIKVLTEDLSPELAKIKTKTLIIWGEKDKLVPVKYAYFFKKKIKNSEIEIIPQVGHSPHIEVPEKLADIILKFLNKNK
jgi:pimeloyl-ACP methyl ester carboxylesterase